MILILALLLSSSIYTWAQQPTANNTTETVTIIELRRNFFKDSLNLNVDVSNVFWHTFDNIENQEYIIHKQFKKDLEEQGIDLRKKNKLNHEQRIYVIQKKLEMKEKILGLDQERFESYKQILPPDKLIKYYNLDHEFKTIMTNKYNKSKQVPRVQNQEPVHITTPATQTVITTESHQN